MRSLILAAALALGLSSAAQAQQQWPGVTIYDRSGAAVGTAANPTATAPAASATIAGPTPTTSTTSTLVGKASAANLYGFSFTQGTTAGFFAILNTATAPASGAAITPIECVAVPVGGYVARRQVIPDRYPAGVVFVSTSSCSTFTAVAPVLMTSVVQ